jgi:uncharacterized protein YegL
MTMSDGDRVAVLQWRGDSGSRNLARRRKREGIDMTTEQTVLEVGRVETPVKFIQGIFAALDFSGSMADSAAGNLSKAESAGIALRELLTRLKASRTRRSFSFGYVTFDTAVRPQLPLTPMDQVDDNADYNRLADHGGGTSIWAALEELERQLTDYFASAPPGGVPQTAVVLLMSDGCCGNPAKTLDVANRLKAVFGPRLTIACCLFATVGTSDAAGQQLLRDVSSDPNRYYKTVYDAETLRGFFQASVSAASGHVRIG